jgi:hypothetical protein
MERIVKVAILSARLAQRLMIVTNANPGFIFIGIIQHVLLVLRHLPNQSFPGLIDATHHAHGINIYTGMVAAILLVLPHFHILLRAPMYLSANFLVPLLTIYSLMGVVIPNRSVISHFLIILSKEKIFVDILVSRMNISSIMELAV